MGVEEISFDMRYDNCHLNDARLTVFRSFATF